MVPPRATVGLGRLTRAGYPGPMGRLRGTGGFTLIELMIVVGIISVLASAAIPYFLRYLRKARDVEALHNIDKMARGAQAYFHARSRLPSATCSPTACSSGVICAPWTPTPTQAICDHAGIYPASAHADFRQAEFRQMLFKPEGKIRFRYCYSGDTPLTALSLLSGDFYAWRYYRCGGPKRVQYHLMLTYGDGVLHRKGPRKNLW